MLAAFGIAIFLAAGLLFVVQPMVGKVLLPLLGGSPSVWNTCMVFFQGVLLLGYLYAHLLSTRLKPRAQVGVHLVVLLAAAAMLPSPVEVGSPVGREPVWWVVRTLALTIGLPFFAVSTSGPLLQRWFSRTDHPAASDPYFLYAASNAGSLLGLLSYPAVVEPLMTRHAQAFSWAVGFWMLAPLVLACAFVASRSRAGGVPEAAPAAPSVGWSRRVRWVVLAAVPSSLMLGVTQHMGTDIASIPLLWIIPLGLYLLSFVLAFSRRWGGTSSAWGRVLPVLVVVAMLTMLARSLHPIPLILGAHVAAFFVAAMMCHRRLAEDRPPAASLTEFYLCLSLGGVLGGAFNALAAPVLFDSVVEYAVVLALACLLRPQVAGDLGSMTRSRRQVEWVVALGAAALVGICLAGAESAHRRYVLLDGWMGRLLVGRLELDPDLAVRVLMAGVPSVLCISLLPGRGSLRFGACAAVLLVASNFTGVRGVILHQERSFFGVSRVGSDQAGRWHSLTHGTTLHGLQGRDESVRRTPSTYYHPTGPIGQVILMMQNSGGFGRAAFVGLGAGSLAAYGRAGDVLDFYEIDPSIIRIAREPAYFTYVADAEAAGATVRFMEGDGRLGLASPDVPGASYDLIAVDAFSSDMIPVHLLTLEAVRAYQAKIRPGGLLAFHVSNRYFELRPALWRIAGEVGWECWHLDDGTTEAQEGEGKKESVWVVLARDRADLGPLARIPTRWEPYRPGVKEKTPLWTDDFSPVLDAFVGWKLPE